MAIRDAAMSNDSSPTHRHIGLAEGNDSAIAMAVIVEPALCGNPHHAVVSMGENRNNLKSSPAFFVKESRC
jgi:hypothetical protein